MKPANISQRVEVILRRNNPFTATGTSTPAQGLEGKSFSERQRLAPQDSEFLVHRRWLEFATFDVTCTRMRSRSRLRKYNSIPSAVRSANFVP